MGISIKKITLLVSLTTILFSQEIILSYIPNVQLTGLLIVLYSKTVGFKMTTIILVLHVLLDNILFGGISFLYTPSMLLGWLFIPITLCSIFKKVDSEISLAFLGILYGFIYSWMFVIPNVLINDISIKAYLAADIWFEIILAMSNFLAILILYKPLKTQFDNLLEEYNLQ